MIPKSNIMSANESHELIEGPVQVDGLVCSNVRLVRSGSEFFELLEGMIHGAGHFIHVQTYIFKEDETGLRITRALVQAAERGVKVYLLLDGYASQGLSEQFLNKLEESGIFFKYFDPLLKSKYFYFGRRLHHKLVVIDGVEALVGGINISDNYNDTFLGAAWLDWALYVEGEPVREIQQVCERRTQTSPPGRALMIRDDQPVCPVNVRINDWVRGKRQITNGYLRMMQNAESRITIMSSYFLPGKALRRQLVAAIQRGIRVRVVLAGISDVRFAKYAERYMYDWLLRNGIEVYEYQPRILHAKLAVCDGKWLTVGSYNVNNISAYASIELNLEIKNTPFAQNAERRIDKIIERDCVQITEEVLHRKFGLVGRFLQRSAYDIFRILLFLFTFYFKQRE